MRYLYHSILTLFLLFSTGAFAGPVDINQADAGVLADAIVGIGAKKAALIVEYRDQHGPFASVDELAQVKGIGASTIDRNRANLMVGEPAN